MKNTYYLLLMFFLFSCGTGSESNSPNFKDIPEFEPQEIRSVQSIDSLYYSYLGINSFTNGSDVILPVWDPTSLVRTGENFESVIAQTSKGQGPGELQDIGVPSQDGEGNILVYDQFQAKFAKFSPDLDPIMESILEPFGEWRTYRIFSGGDSSKIFINMSGNLGFTEKMRNQEEMIAAYDVGSGNIIDSVRTFGKVWTPTGPDINGRFGSAFQVPFSRKSLIHNIPESGTLLLFDTGSGIIAEVNHDLDTLRAIPVDLPTEKISEAELDSIAITQELSNDDIKRIEDRLPEFKATTSDMKYYNGQIWLKSNIKADKDIWFVLNMDGKILGKVLLPASSYLTHISGEHLGVRLDEVTFALYDPVMFDL